MARPRAKADPDQIEKLAAIFCSLEEIAAVTGCSVSTLQRRFDQAIKKGRERGKMSLKRKQFEVAMGGNSTMLIWMGKQHLDQKDRATHELSGPDGKPIETKNIAEISNEQLDEQIKTLIEKQSQ